MTKQVCNVCGKEFDMWDTQEGFGMNYHVGYGSKYDGAVIQLDMCCDCFDKLMDYMVDVCKHNPVAEREF